MSQRVDIIDDIADRLTTKFGPSGTVGTWLERVSRGPWNPGRWSTDHAWVTDNGQRKLDSYNDDETNKTLALRVSITLGLRTIWEEKWDFWSDRVQAIIADLYNWLPAYGALRMNYLDDEPVSIVWADGSAGLEMWVINFEVHYMTDVGVIGKS